MANKKDESKQENEAPVKIVTGNDHKLDAREQGQLARGEIDEAGKATGKEGKKDHGKTVKPSETLYQGKLSAEGINVVTGEKVSYVWVQVEPTTEDGCFNAVNFAFGGNIRRDSFKLDPDNKIDPTLRTHLERL